MVENCQKWQESDQVQEEVVKAIVRFSKGQKSLYLNVPYSRNLEQHQGSWVRGELLECLVRFSEVPSNFQVLGFHDHENH